MTTSKKSGIELREDLTIFKTTKGIRFEKNIEKNNLITEIKLNDINGYELSLNKKDNTQAIWAISGFLLALFPIPSGDFFNNWVNILIYFPVGYYLYLNEE